MKKITFTSAIIFLFLTNSVIISQQTEKEETKYRRITPEDFQLQEQNKKSKEEVFPLGWNTGTLGKATTGTGVWTELNPKVPRVDYIGIDFINADTGWACGMSGAIIKTIDGGDSWTIAETPVTSILLKIHSFNGNVVIATGWDGVILRSDDGGENFTEITNPSGTNNDLWGLQMLNDTLGWVCGTGSMLLKTTDAGLTWNGVFPGLSGHYWSLEFLDEHYGFIPCATGKLLKTTDGGESWAIQDINDSRGLFTVDIIDSLHIAAAGEYGHTYPQLGGISIYSSDGGEIWEIKPEIPTGTDTYFIEYENRDTGYAICEWNQFMKTTDRGETWFNPVSYNRGLAGEWHIELLEDGTGYIGGRGLNFFKRTNGLDNWKHLFINTDLRDVFFHTEEEGFVLGGGLFKTTNGGSSFEIVDGAPAGDCIEFINDSTGFIGYTYSTRIYKTTDRGVNWERKNITGITDSIPEVRKIFFIDQTTGWAVARNIYKTTDGGENWFFQASAGGADYFSSIFFIDSLNGWATSRYIWQTTDGGNNWIEQTDNNLFFTRDVYFGDTLNGIILESNDMHVTTNGGSTWNLHPIVTGFGFGKVVAYDNMNIFIVGTTKLFSTKDGGENWIEFPEVSGKELTNMNFINYYIGYAVGNKGLVLRYFDSTYVPVELVSFGSIFHNGSIILTWTTASELNNLGFYIERSSPIASSIFPLDEEWTVIGFINGKGTTTEVNHYNFTDNTINKNGKYFYRLKQMDFDGSFSYSNIIEMVIPANDFLLSQNYPNPANPSTNISFSTPKKANIKIRLYSIAGELVKEIVNEEKERGKYNLKVDLSQLASGVYFYRMTTNKGYSYIRKLVLLK